MRVLHAIESEVLGGAEKVALSLGQGLARRGYTPVFAVPAESWLAKETQRLGLERVLLPSRRRADWRFVRWLLTALREQEIALVHAHLMAMNLYGSLAACLARRPSIATLHGRLYDLERPRRRLAYRLIARTASRLVAVSEELGQALVEEAGIPRDRVRVIPNGVERPTALPASRSARPPTIITVGALTEVKGHEFLIEAMAEVRKEFPAARLVIVGEGPRRAALEAMCAEGGAVSFLGEREEIGRLLGESDVFILPSLSEGQSLALLEAMAVGLPVVATRVGGNQEIVRHGEDGWLVAPAAPQEMAAAISTLLRDKALASRLGEAARQRVQTEFSFEATLDRYEALYKELLCGQKPAVGGVTERGA